MSNSYAPRPLVEICCPGIERAREAFAKGADRVELCRDIDCGGLTPTNDDLAAIPSLSHSTRPDQPRPVHVLIRPRPGDFVYDEAEITLMLEQIDRAAACKAAGVVIGALTPSGDIDLLTCRRLIDRAHRNGLSVTFHRAIDEAADYLLAYRDVCTLRPDRILTSGGAPTAYAGRFRLAEIIGSSSAPKGAACSGTPFLSGPSAPSFTTAPPSVSCVPASQELVSAGPLPASREVASSPLLSPQGDICPNGAASGGGHVRCTQHPSSAAPLPIIMPGKGITAENVGEILRVTGATEVHGTRLEIINAVKS